jgi:hypothetical protein
MKSDDPKEKHAEVNPAARRDRPGEPHGDLADREPEPDEPAVKPYQQEPLDPLDQGGIGG